MEDSLEEGPPGGPRAAGDGWDITCEVWVLHCNSIITYYYCILIITIMIIIIVMIVIVNLIISIIVIIIGFRFGDHEMSFPKNRMRGHIFIYFNWTENTEKHSLFGISIK